MRLKKYLQINNKIAIVSTLVLLALSASIISELIWKVLEKDGAPNLNSKLVIQHGVKKLPMPTNLFGVFNSTIKQQHSNIKSTRLNLTLIGILNQKNQSLAIIKQGGGQDKIYKINDFIDSSTMIKEVHAKYIILARNGGFEKLTMKRNKIDFTKNKNVSMQPPISTTNKSKLLGYLKQLNTNPKELLSIVSVKPNYTKDGMNGFTISPGIEHKLFDKLGLKRGDIITHINNIEINSLSQAIKLRKELSKQTYFDFMIERKGRTLSLSINLNQ